MTSECCLVAPGGSWRPLGCRRTQTGLPHQPQLTDRHCATRTSRSVWPAVKKFLDMKKNSTVRPTLEICIHTNIYTQHTNHRHQLTQRVNFVNKMQALVFPHAAGRTFSFPLKNPTANSNPPLVFLKVPTVRLCPPGAFLTFFFGKNCDPSRTPMALNRLSRGRAGRCSQI